MKLRDQIAAWLRSYERLAVLGIGNPLRGDDAIGVEVLKRLEGKVSESVGLYDCEMVPENFLSEIELFRPTHVLLIDAAQLEIESGEARLIPPEKIAGTALSTHAMPLSILAGVIRENLKAKVVLLGIQPERTELGEGLSPRLQKASKEIAGIVIEAVKRAK
ncbi:MAG: hydrogenase 3 maturation endopeptidase HyCI [Candidatus Bathyarchaeota archaeon]|nr:hydrogenase 3 maturation endopeptidase HyCI [Candidatus Bathyarchaeota archaeon]